MASDSEQDRDARVDRLVAQIVRLRESGDEVLVTELLAQHPDLADSVEGFLKDQAFLEQAAKGASSDTDANEARQTEIKPQHNSNPEPTALAAGPAARTGNEEPAASAVGSGERNVPAEPETTYVMAFPAEIAAGVKPFGRYRIENLLGEGAMGAVYLAHDTQLDRKVALKTPKFNSDNAVRLSKRFRREAQSAATLHHRNICPVYDVGQIDGLDYLTMAYIEGKPLSAYVNPDKPLAQRQIALVIRKLALALQAAHDAGVVHRDLKPSNVIIDREGEPVVMDFGLAGRVDNTGSSRLTKSGTILGTPAYMAPEQIEGRQKLIGPRSDVYSLGVVMYELLSGRLPFRGSPASVMGKVLVAKPPSLKDVRPDIDPDLAGICEAMMVKHPGKRTASMVKVAEKLTAWIRASRQAEQPPQATSSKVAPPPLPAIVTTGEEMAALSKQAASRWKVDSKEISDARRTNEVKPIGWWLKTKAWFDSLPPRNRWWIAAAGAAVPLLLLLGVTIIIKIKIDDDGNVTTEVTREPPALAAGPDDTTSANTTSNGATPATSAVASPAFGPWITMFDGNGTSEWEHLGAFRVSGNELVADTKGAAKSKRGAAKSKRIFEDFELEFEWKLERGGNSGVYYRADPRAAFNVWPFAGSSEFALDATHSPPAPTANGALWNVLAPTTSPHIDPERFRNAKIVCSGTEIEHWIGGMLVLKYDTSAPSFQRVLADSRNQWLKEGGPRDSGRIYLQSNVGEIRFRNIRIREIIRPQISGVSITARDLHFLGSTRKSDGWHGWNTLQVNHDGNPVIVSEWGSEPKGLYRMTSQGSLKPIATGDLFIDPESFAETDDGYYVTNAGGQGTVVFVPKNGDVPTRIGSDQLYDPYGILVAPPTFHGPNVAPGDLIVFDNAAGDKERQGIKSFNRQTGTVKLLCRQGSFGGGYNTKGELFAIDNTQEQTTSIVKIDASGSVETVLSHFPGAAGYVGSAGHLAIHPTTDVFYFSVDGTVYAYKDSSEQPRPIIDGGFHVNDWSPDGKLLYLQKDKFEVWALEHAYIQRLLAQDRSAGVHPAIPPDAAVFEGHSYKVFAEVLSWKDAQRRCEAMGGHLATISHSAENRFVLNLVKAKFPKPEFRDAVWLGATDEVNEGQWIWVDGQPVDFTNWFKPEGAGQQGGQPNNKYGIEHYMIMWFGNGERVGDEWCDQPNVSTQHRCYFVCEWDGLPIARTSNPAPTPIAASPDSSSDTGRDHSGPYEGLASGTWVSLMPELRSDLNQSSDRPGNEETEVVLDSIADFSARHARTSFSHDAVVRARIQVKARGELNSNQGLSPGRYVAYVDRGAVGVGKNAGGWKDICRKVEATSFGDDLELSFARIKNRLIVFVNGTKVLDCTDQDFQGGTVGITSLRSTSAFSKVEFMDLSQTETPTPTTRTSSVRRPQTRVLPIDVTRTYLKTAPNDSARPAIPIDLDALGYAPGDRIRLCKTGRFEQGENTDPRLYGLFSSSKTVLEHSRLHRVPGAIDARKPAWTCKIWETWGGGETNIPEDFAIADGKFESVEITIPPKAKYLFVTPWNGAVAIPLHKFSNLAVEISLVSLGNS